MMRRSNSGIIIIDFLFALVISFGVGAVLFALSYSLVMAQVTQYVAFSSGRAFSSGNLSPEAQVNAGRDQYERLISSRVYGNLRSRGWFSVSDPDELEIRDGLNGRSFDQEYSNNTDLPFLGVRVRYSPRVLNLNIPFLGPTSLDPEGFVTNITGFMLREPTVVECQTFMEQRAEALVALDSRFGQLGPRPVQDYHPMEDNGC